MTERESLYAAICAHPLDDLPKLVFADWLDEQGDAVYRVRAELIRIQCEWEANARGYERALEPYRLIRGGELGLDPQQLTKVDPVAGRAQALLIRAAQHQTPADPVGPFLGIPGTRASYAGPIRGLRTELLIYQRGTCEPVLSEIASQLPLRDLTLSQAYGNEDILDSVESLDPGKHSLPCSLSNLLKRPELVHLRKLTFYGNPFCDEVFSTLTEGEYLTGLEEIKMLQVGHIFGEAPSELHRNIVRNLRRWWVSTNGLGRRYRGLPLILPFLEEPESQLQELELESPSDADDIATILGRRAGGLARLQSLTLGGRELTARGACDLLATDQLPKLRHLDLSGSILGDLVGRRLEKANDYPKIHSLDASNSHLSVFGIAALARWPGFAGLRKLVLSDNAFNHCSMRGLASAEAPHLRTLGLANCRLHDSHIRELVTSPLVRSLWTLDLRNNPFRESGGRALAESPFLDELQHLILDLPESDTSIPHLRQRFGQRLQLG